MGICFKKSPKIMEELLEKIEILIDDIERDSQLTREETLDPLKEIKAYREAEQAGYMTKSQVIAQTNGGDYDDIVSEIAREQDVADSLGVTLDKDLDLEVEMGTGGNVNITPPPPNRSKKTRKKAE